MTDTTKKLREALQVALDALTFDGFCPQDITHRTLCAEAASQLRQALTLPTEPAHADTWGISRAMVTLYAYECDGLTGEALALPTADHLPDTGKMIETAAPVGERLTLSAEDVHAAFVKHFPKTRISQAWIGFAAEIAEAIAARAALRAKGGKHV